MHQFTSFLALALMVGAAIFTMQYLLYPHVHPIARIFTSIGFVIGIDAENQMHYDWQFYQQVVLWMGFAIVVSLAVRFAFIPRQPDVLFMKVLDQFFRHADFLLSERDADGRRDRSLSRRIRWIFHRHSLSEEAARLALFAGQVDPRTGRTTYRELRGATPEQVQELVRCVYALAHRVEAYVAAREESRSFAVDRHLLSEKQQWQRTVRDWFSRGPDAARADGPLGSLQERLVRLETRIEEAFVRVDDDEELSTEDYENFFVRLGNFRGLSEAAVDFARVAQGFDWPRWRETRF